MILPIGTDQTSVERLPWLTFALLATLVVGFFAARGGVGIAPDAPEVKPDSALEVWLSHPYLEPDPALVALANADEATAERVEAARRAGARTPLDAATHAREQAELDDVTRLALRGSDSEPGAAHPFRRFGWVPAEPHAAALLTHPFMHAGYAHLCLALLLIWLVGPALEDAFGRLLFAALCAGGALAAAGGYALAQPAENAPLIGASGLAAGLLGAFAVRHARGEIRFAWLSFARTRLASGTFSAPAWLALPGWLVGSAGLHFLFGGSGVETGESLAPSISGLAFGAAFAFGLRAARIEEHWLAPAREAKREIARLDPRIQRALDAHARGEHDEAIALATSVLRDRPDDPDALLAVWSAELAAGREAKGAAAAKRLIEIQARHGQLAAAARLYEELGRALPDVRLDTTVLLRLVPELVVQARRDAAIAALRTVVSPDNKSLTVGQAVRAAELAVELDPPCALAAARRALAPADLAPERREKLERLVHELEAKLGGAPAEPAAAATEEPAPAPRALEPEPAPVPAEPEPLEIERASYREMETVVYAAPPPAPLPAPSAPAPLEPAEAAAPKLTPAVPTALDPGGLVLRIDGAEPALVAWERIQAVGVGLVSGLAAKPVVVIDLALNWAESHSGELEVLRLRSDSFRARALVGGDGSALEALRALLAQLLARSGAVPLPDSGSARGLPFREFPDPSSYEREVLLQAG